MKSSFTNDSGTIDAGRVIRRSPSHHCSRQSALDGFQSTTVCSRGLRLNVKPLGPLDGNRGGILMTVVERVVAIILPAVSFFGLKP